jgi:RHS repeat-associated protein
MKANGHWYTHNFYHADGNGNITYLVSGSQTVAASYRYDPFGNTISSSGGLASANTYRFSSKEIHADSGLYYYGYRWYAPNLQRWVNRDPIAERGGINLFGFVLNAPANHVDSFGLVVCFNPADCAAQCGCAAVDLSQCIKRAGGWECDCNVACVPPPTPRPPTSPGRSFDHHTNENGVDCTLICYCPNGDSVVDAAFSSDGCTCNYVGGTSSKGGFGKVCGCRWVK